jgi:hypothetical protein
MEVERQVLRELPFYNRDVLGKNLVIEVEGVFNPGVLIEVAADGNQQTDLACGDRRSRVQDVKQPSSRKRDRQFRSEREKDFESPMLLEVLRREMLVSVSIIADRADVVGDEASLSLCHLVIRNNWIVGFANAFLVNEGEVAHVKKAFDLPSRSGFDVHIVQSHLKIVWVVPLGQFRQIRRGVVGQTQPDKTVLFQRLIHVETQARRDGSSRMRRDAGAATGAIVAQTVTPATISSPSTYPRLRGTPR